MPLFPMLSLLAQAVPTATSTTLEFDWPYSAGDWGLLGLIGIATLFTLWMYYRDTAALSRVWLIWLTGLRLAVLGVLTLIALNPHLRKQSEVYRPSHVALLVDTSTSMQQPESDPRSGTSNQSRIMAVGNLLQNSELLTELRQQHIVDLYTFNSDLSGVQARFPTTYVPEGETAPEAIAQPDVNWDEILQTTGNATNLGDSLDKLLAEIKSSTLSGVVVFSDGSSNAGREVRVARERAQANSVRLITVGVGSTQPPVNLALVKGIVPTDVQKGDIFEITGYLQGQGLSEKSVLVELLQQLKGETEPVLVDRREVVAPPDGEPFEVTFERNPPDPGEYEFTLRASVPQVVESRQDDNLLVRAVNVFDRPLKVLMLAGGPMRDYRYARTILHRHPSVEVDVWLQTGSVGISQESHRILYRFPESREEFFQYDLLIAFDPDWSLIDAEHQQMIADWVTSEGGGVIAVAGDVNTPRLAGNDATLETIVKLYPVLLDEVGLQLGSRDEAGTAYPIGLTQDGEAAEFLKLDESGDSDPWQEFRGLYRCYPTRGVKAGTTVYAEFTDPLSRGAGGQPALIAMQRYGQGNVLYLGSPEFWRLRSVKEEYLDRFWTKLIRKGAEGRSKRGLQRGMFVLEGRDYDVGQNVPIRVRAVNAQYEPLAADSIALEVYDPNGRPQIPALQLQRDANRPAEYTGDLRVVLPGRYRLELAIPDATETLSAELNVQLSRLEASSLIQNAELLQSLTRETGGRYLPLSEALAQIPQLLPNQGERAIIDEQIEEQWDQLWVLMVLAGLLSLEWLSRKLIKLA